MRNRRRVLQSHKQSYRRVRKQAHSLKLWPEGLPEVSTSKTGEAQETTRMRELEAVRDSLDDNLRPL